MGRVKIVVGLGAWLFATVAHANVVPQLAPELELSTRRQVPLSTPHLRGNLVHDRFSINGVPVQGAFETRRVFPDGREEVTASVAPAAVPQFAPEDREVEPDALPAIVADYLGASGPPAFEVSPQLVYLVVLRQPVLAWEVQLPLCLNPEPSRKTLWVSAMTGRVLDEQEQVRSARARVFLENPSATPEPVDVLLGGIETSGPGDPLVGDRVVSLNCVREEPDEVVPYWDEGECYPTHTVLSDADGNFYVPLPDIIDVADNIRGQDRYAELSMYFHAERFLDKMRQLGVEEFKCETATMLANFRTLEPEGDLPYTPLNNAFYSGQCNPQKGPTMIFGQGSEVDFGYDGDVVYHELGHGMVALLTPEGLGGAKERPEASSPDAGALNEAVADYFAFLMTADPDLAEYVGRFWTSSGRAQIRTGENQKSCPDSTIGQVHNDGEPMGAALWATRVRVGPIFDEILLEALTRLPKRASLEDAAAVLLEVGADYRDQGDLDAFGFDVLSRSLVARGLTDCLRVIDDPAEVEEGRSMHFRKAGPGVQPFWPGPMQLRHQVPPGETSAEIVMSLRVRGDEPLAARVLVKRGDEPIYFEYDLVAVDDFGDATGTATAVREVTRISGDWDWEIDPTPVGDGGYRVELESLRPGEILHVMVVSASPGEVAASGVAVRTPGYEGDVDTDTDTDAEPNDGTDVVRADGAVAGGCGCDAGAPAPAGAKLAGLWLLLWIRRPR